MNVQPTKLDGVLIIEPTVYRDERGFFLETYNERIQCEAGIKQRFVQENHSRSTSGVLRGLHAQKDNPQGKLVRVSRGRVFDVAADINKDSPSYGEWVGFELSDENNRFMYIPPGYLHGFLVLSDIADFQYMCTEYYVPSDEVGVIWNDPTFNIDWPTDSPILSEKDQRLPRLTDL